MDAGEPFAAVVVMTSGFLQCSMSNENLTLWRVVGVPSSCCCCCCWRGDDEDPGVGVNGTPGCVSAPCFVGNHASARKQSLCAHVSRSSSRTADRNMISGADRAGALEPLLGVLVVDCIVTGGEVPPPHTAGRNAVGAC